MVKRDFFTVEQPTKRDSSLFYLSSPPTKNWKSTIQGAFPTFTQISSAYWRPHGEGGQGAIVEFHRRKREGERGRERRGKRRVGADRLLHTHHHLDDYLSITAVTPASQFYCSFLYQALYTLISRLSHWVCFSRSSTIFHIMAASFNVLLALWVSQFLSLIGSDVTKFALRVWVFDSTGSVTQYALISFCTEAPALLLSPVLGLAIDRLPRRFVLIAADALGAVFTLALYFTGSPSPSTVLVSNIFSSLLGSVHWAAFSASAKLLLPPSGLVGFAAAAQFAPALSMLVRCLRGVLEI